VSESVGRSVSQSVTRYDQYVLRNEVSAQLKAISITQPNTGTVGSNPSPGEFVNGFRCCSVEAEAVRLTVTVQLNKR
jgi:hypothetical protein